MLSFSYSLTKEDYINCYTYMTWDAPAKRKKHLRYYVQQIITNGVIVLVLLYSGLLDNKPSWKYIYIAILVAIVLLQFFSGRSKVKRQADKITDDPDNASIFKQTALQVSETGIYTKDDVVETRYSWNAFIRKEENNAYYLLFINKITAVIIPKRIFKSTAEKESFDHLLSTHLSFDAEIAHFLK